MGKRRPDLSSPKAAEQAFYQAFADCDPAAMAGVWASEGVVCIHPGAPPVIGREAVLRSWSGILTGAARPSLRVVLLKRLEQGALAVHLVEEHIAAPEGDGDGTLVLATNIYCREQDGWRLLEHHASLPAAAQRHSLQ